MCANLNLLLNKNTIIRISTKDIYIRVTRKYAPGGICFNKEIWFGFEEV